MRKNDTEELMDLAVLSPHAHLFWFLRTGLYYLLLVLGLVLLVQQVIKGSWQPSDFCQDYIAAQRLAHGQPVYSPLHLWAGYSACPVPLPYDAHPPFSILFFFPLVLLPNFSASLLWGGISHRLSDQRPALVACAGLALAAGDCPLRDRQHFLGTTSACPAKH